MQIVARGKAKKALIQAIGLGLLMLCAWPSLAAEPVEVRYPTLSEPYGQHANQYFLDLLTLALDEAEEDYRLKKVVFPQFREARSEISLIKGLYDVHWLNTSSEREARLRPIRIPLYKGLIGWRLLMVKKDGPDPLSGVTSLESMKALLTVQGHDWPDTEILTENGFRVIRTAHWEGLFKMLSAGRVDYLPRSIVEVWRELEQFSDWGLVVNKELALVYPSAYYFFVSKDNEALAQAIETGLNRAIDNGSFDRLFQKYFADDIERAALHRRKILMLANPLLPSDTPLARRELWFSLPEDSN